MTRSRKRERALQNPAAYPEVRNRELARELGDEPTYDDLRALDHE